VEEDSGNRVNLREEVSVKKKARVLSALALGVSLVGPVNLSWAQPKREIVDSFRSGKSVLEKKCKLCHSLRLPLSKVYSRDEWKVAVKRMVTYGAPLDAGERTDLIAYLAGRSSFARNCSGCHDAARVVPDDDGGRDWTAILKRMSGHVGELEAKGLSRGIAPLPDDALEEIAAFLTIILGDN
jgi:cytochrome c2